MRLKEVILSIILFLFLTLVYLFPLFQGLILMPLDLLISNYSPWYSPATILLKNPYMQDSIVQLYPWKHLVYQSFKDGIIPFWNPYQHMGMPFMASLKPMVFYPFNILFLFGEIKAWNLLLFSQIFLSMFFSYLLARDFKLGVFSSILVSLAFSLNSLMIGFLEFGSDGHVLLWAPLFFLSVKRYIEKQKARYLFLLSLVLTINIFAGQLQFTFYILISFVAFTFYYGVLFKTKLSTYLLIFLSILLGFGLSAIQLIPSLELFSQSYRGIAKSYDIFAVGLIKPYQLFRLFAPDFFGNPVTRDSTIGYIETSGYFGIIPLFFAFYAILYARKNIFVNFFSILFILTLLFSLDRIGSVLYFLKVPLITSGSGGRLFFLTIFSCSILSGFGLTEFINTKSKRKYVFLIVFVFLFGVAILSSILFKLSGPETFIKNIKFSSMILGAFILAAIVYFIFYRNNRYIRILFLFAVIFLTFFDLFRLGYRFLTFSNEKFFYPELNVVNFIRKSSIDDLGRNIGLTEPELATFLNVYTVETYNPLYLLRTGKLMNVLQERPVEEALPVNKYFLTLKSEKTKYTMDFLGVKYLVMDNYSNPIVKFFNKDVENNFSLAYKDDKFSVYKNDAYHRFGLYYKTYKAKNDAEALQLISKGSINFKNKIIIENDLPLALKEGSGSSKIIYSDVNTQKFSIKTDKPALFYISDTYYPGWKAKVNGKETRIYRTNYNFRSIIVPAGETVVEFSYIPSGFRLGIIISFSSFLVLILIIISHRRIIR